MTIKLPKMKNYISKPLFILVLSFFTFMVSAQDQERVLLQGQVLYRNVNVPNETVINITTENATSTDKNGRFAILVNVGDELAFTAVNYQLEVVKVTEALLKKGRLVVEVKEKVTELEEVIVTPEQQQKFLEMQNEDFKDFEYEGDRSTPVDNIALSQAERGREGDINFVNIFKALVRASKKKKETERKPMKPSEVLRLVYEDEFFVLDLKLPQDKIDSFLLYLDTKNPMQSLLKKENEFELIDYLVTHSKTYLKEIDAER